MSIIKSVRRLLHSMREMNGTIALGLQCIGSQSVEAPTFQVWGVVTKSLGRQALGESPKSPRLFSGEVVMSTTEVLTCHML